MIITFMRKQRTWVLACFFVTVLILLLFDVLKTSRIIRTIEHAAYSWRFEMRPAQLADPAIMIFGVETSTLKIQQTNLLDKKDYEESPVLRHFTPKWPWDRQVFAEVLNKLCENGAKMVIFDFAFFSSTPGDVAFAKALERWRDRAVIASKYEIQQTAEGSHSVVFYEPIEDILPDPLRTGDKYNDLIGFADVNADEDKAIRRAYYEDSRVLLNFRANPGSKLSVPEDSVPSDMFSMMAVAAMKLNPSIVLPKRAETNYVNYAGGNGTYRMIPLEELFLPVRWKRWETQFQNGAIFKDKIVIVGPYSEVQFKDYHSTPLGTMPGPEIQVNSLVTLLRNNFITPLSPVYNAILNTVFGVLALVILLHVHHVLVKTFWMAFATLVFAVGSQAVFNYTNVQVSVHGFLFMFVIGGNFSILYDFILEQYNRRRIHSMFGTYVSPDVVDSMIHSGEEPQLGGVDKELTCFFSDVQSFSGFSEVLTPAQLVDLMNEYLTAMTDILHENGGTLDKYIGDAIVAMFGAPLELPDHAYKGCFAACLMQIRQNELREKWKSEGGKWPELCHHMNTRIGLNTGHVTVGNMGSRTRFNYTFMGDNVNLAARCESGAKSLGVYTMVTESTYLEAKKHGNEVMFRYLDKIKVKGRKTAVGMYEVVGLKEKMTSDHYYTLELFEKGIGYYQKRQWDLAIAQFERALQYEPYHPDRYPGSSGTPSHILLERCHQYKKDDPGDAWDGVYVMKTK